MDEDVKKALKELTEAMVDAIDGRFVGDGIYTAPGAKMPRLGKDVFEGLEFRNEGPQLFCERMSDLMYLPAFFRAEEYVTLWIENWSSEGVMHWRFWGRAQWKVGLGGRLHIDVQPPAMPEKIWINFTIRPSAGEETDEGA